MIPLVIFDNHKICEYARILERTQDNNKINCISYSDFQEMCKNIVSPIEIVEYLEYRQAFYNNYPNCDMYVDLNEKHIGIVKPKSKESLSRFFGVEKYGLSGISNIEKMPRDIMRFCSLYANQMNSSRLHSKHTRQFAFWRIYPVLK